MKKETKQEFVICKYCQHYNSFDIPTVMNLEDFLATKTKTCWACGGLL